MKKMTLILLLALAGCTDPKAAEKALLDAGYTHITVGGYDAFGCGQDDSYSTKFTATGPTGRPVVGVVCSGIGKGTTIRLH